MSHHHRLPTIDPAELEDVSAGTDSSSCGSDEITAALKGITDSLASLKKANTGGGSDAMQLMMMMMVTGMFSGGGGISIYGRGGGCGCGMPNCGHGCP